MISLANLGSEIGDRVSAVGSVCRTGLRGLSSGRRAIKRQLQMLDARFHRSLSDAQFIAVTGSSGKTTTVCLLAHILAEKEQTFHQFLGNGIQDTTKTLREVERSDKFVVLETGTAKPGQLAQQADLIKPDVAVVTLVALEHYSAFRTAEAVADEKSQLIQALSTQGIAVLNFDNPWVRAMATEVKGTAVGFGIESGDYRISDIGLTRGGELFLTVHPPGKPGFSITTRLLGTYNWLAVAAAVTCAMELGIAPDSIRNRVASFTPVHGRMSVYSIPGGPKFILDTAKAPWFSLTLPFGVVSEIDAPRRRIIIGHISDYAGNPKSKYRRAYEAAREVADQVLFVGPHAHRVRGSDEDIAQEKFRAFASVEACAAYVRETAMENEVILIKSSLNLHLERIWLHCSDGVRCWPLECGLTSRACLNCSYRTPFSDHRKVPPFNSRRRSRGLI